MEGQKPQAEAMTDATAQQLLSLTHSFYARHARTFSTSRRAAWPAWHRLQPLRYGRLLDLGCGNGRFLRFARDAWGFQGTYVGVDSSSELLAEAARELPASGQTQWVHHDLLRDDWPAGEFDLVVAWGLLHHIPGASRRRRLLRLMAHSLAAGGQLALSLWQFRKFERFAHKELVPETYDVDSANLEPGDALLDWGCDQAVPRYCHHFDDGEVARLHRLLAECTELRAVTLGSGGSVSSDRYNAYLSFQRA